jgi:hypothetical protein
MGKRLQGLKKFFAHKKIILGGTPVVPGGKKSKFFQNFKNMRYGTQTAQESMGTRLEWLKKFFVHKK